MSSNQVGSRRSRYSEKEYENSSICNRSLKSEQQNVTLELPATRKKYTNIEHELMQRYNGRQQVIVNLANTKYPILQEVCGGDCLAWKTENFGESRNWQLKWCDTGVVNETLQRMSYNQRINHFPSMSVISRKNTLALTLAKMKDQFPRQYDYFPRTFLFPADLAKIYHYVSQSQKRELLKTFIVKPEAGCQGRGIYLTQNPNDFEKEQKCVIQKYISNPLLYRGLKFDLRVYVLLACISPLRIYIYNEGLVRFATEPYELPNNRNLSNFYMHLTNYAINKSNPSYQYNYSVNDMTHGHKKSLAEFFRGLKEMGYRANTFWSQIKDGVVKTVLAAQPYILSNYRMCRPQETTSNMCFQLLGFDFLIDNQDRVHLLQVNHTPSFSTDTPLDHIIKKNLIKDTLLMMNPTADQLQCLQQLQRVRQRQKFIKFKQGGQNAQREKERLASAINNIRMKHEEEFIGTYQIIYPHRNANRQDKYSEISHFAMKALQPTTTNTNASSNFQLRNRLRQPSYPRQPLSKQNLVKNPPPESKKNIIYNYNNIRHPASKKRLQTLPVQMTRNDSRPRQKISSGKSSILPTKQRMRTQATSLGSMRDIRVTKKISQYKSEQKPIYYQASGNILSDKSRGRQQNKSPQQKKSTKDVNTFVNRIRAYKTPFMS